MKRVAAFAAVLCAGVLFAEEEIEYLEYVESDGYAYADTGICPNPMRTRVHAWLIPAPCPTKTVNAKYGAIFGALGVKGAFNNNKACTCHFGWRGGYSQTHVCPTWTQADSGGYYFNFTGNGDYSLIDVECYQATAWVNGGRQGGYYDAGRYDGELDYSMYIGNANNAGEGLLTAAGNVPRLRWYRFQVWTNEIEVADFVAAKKGAAVGFYDKVSGAFVSSEDPGHPFLAPDRVVWTGKGDPTNLNDSENWAGGMAPTQDQVVRIPSGTSLAFGYQTVPDFFNGTAGISFEDETSELVFTNGDVAVTLQAPVFGTGKLKVLDSLCTSTAANALSIYSGNYNFTGDFVVSNAAVYVHGSGTAGRGKTYMYSVNRAGCADKRRFTMQKGEQYCEFHFQRQEGAYFITHEGSTFENDFYIDPPGDWTYHSNGGHTFTHKGTYTYTGTERKTANFSGVVAFRATEGRTNDIGKLQLQATSYIFASPMKVEKQAANYMIYNQCNIALNTGHKDGMVFARENVFEDHVSLLFDYAKYITEKPVCIMNLSGFDQRVGTLATYSTQFDAATQWNENLCITSPAPATLTVCGTCRCDSSRIDGKDYHGVYPGVVAGEASIVLDAKDENMCDPNATVASKASMRFNCPDSTTSGGLVAKSGTIELMSTCTFPNLTQLKSAGEGKIIVNTSEVGTETNLLVALSAPAAGTVPLTIGEGCTLTADTAVVGDDRWLDEGDYTKADLPKYIAGEGTLHVNRYGGPRGLMILLR